MPQSVLALALTLAVLACGPSQASNAEADLPASLAAVETLPAAPPASNTEAVVDADGEVVSDTADTETAATYRAILAEARAQDVAARPYGEVVQWVGEQLLGRPYAAGMLDAPETETLVVDLTAFDCVLYIENVLAIARAIATGDDSYEAYAQGVEDLRYREGEMNGYCSRLHYFSEWIADNEARGTVRNVTEAVGGEPFAKQITFMSENRDSYPKLVSDETYACVVDMEVRLGDLALFYIPQERIAEAYPMLRPGDVIATATRIGGLDVTHTGFVHQTEAGTGFMHASLSSNEVVISDDLEDYVQGIRSQVGVIVARPLDPRAASGS
ncbi:MAG: N-acetylmuramoyl-L-alanine amidase-like domain-containing protein [Bacteroidota bacterium]